MGVHPRHSDPSGEEPGPDEVGGSPRWRLQVSEVGGRGSAVGSEEEKQQHDLRETESSYEVRLYPWITARNYHKLSLITSNYHGVTMGCNRQV